MNTNRMDAQRAWTDIRAYMAAVYFVLATACVSSSVLAANSGMSVLDLNVEQALLAEDWIKVAELLREVDTTSASPVLRLIKGHACLALNRNNASLELFASMLKDTDSQAWQVWTDEFASRHSQHAIAWYFKGDAQARHEQWESAGESFEKAVQLDPRCYLAWNARGVVAHAVGNTLMARTYFLYATKTKGDFADAYASRGTLNICLGNQQDQQSPFAQARRCSSDESALVAINGLGCAAYGQNKLDDALSHFQSIPANSGIAALVERNIAATELRRLLILEGEAQRAGMSIQALTLKNAIAVGGHTPESEDEFWQRMIQLAYKRLAELEEEYRKNCGGAAAGSAYCKSLLEQIEELKRAIAEITGAASSNTLSGPSPQPDSWNIRLNSVSPLDLPLDFRKFLGVVTKSVKLRAAELAKAVERPSSSLR